MTPTDPPAAAQRPVAATVVTASPRLPGLLSAAGWDALRAGRVVHVRDPGEAWRVALVDAGCAVVEAGAEDRTAPGQTWLDLSGAEPGRPAPEGAGRVVRGAVEPPGTRVLDLVAVMDRLRSPGGCPWDAAQTHESLLRHLVEEAYEVVEAVETGGRDDLLEELGDLLLQVVFHARLAAERPQEPFGVDDVADGIASKLVRRHPHVFADGYAPTAEHVEATWERAKAVEKQRTSALDGVPAGLPALARAEKVLDRLERHGVAADLPAGGGLGEQLLRDVAAGRAAGESAEVALRAAVRRFEARVRRAESDVRRAGSGGAAPG